MAFATRAMLEALDNIGREIKSDGLRYGSCLQTCLGVTYFMDTSRELQSFPVYRAGMPQDASLYRKHDQAVELMQEILFDNPVAAHHIPADAR